MRLVNIQCKCEYLKVIFIAADADIANNRIRMYTINWNIHEDPEAEMKYVHHKDFSINLK
jgi:hypothetical protein